MVVGGFYSLGPLEILNKLPHWVGREGYAKSAISASSMLGHDIIMGTPATYMAVCTSNHINPETSLLQQQEENKAQQSLGSQFRQTSDAGIPSAQSSLVRLHIHATSRPIKVAAR